MRHDNGKFMVQLLHGLTHKQIFFLVWFVIVSIFVLLMMSIVKKSTRRNFRSASDGPPPPKIQVDARRLADSNQPHDLVAKGHSHPSVSHPHDPHSIAKKTGE